MKHKTAELEGFWLHYAVGKAEGFVDMLISPHPAGQPVRRFDRGSEVPYTDWAPAERWDQGGPIIERERIGVWPTDYFVSHATLPGAPIENFGAECRLPGRAWLMFGRTMLEAGMRAFVASKLGEEVELP